MTGSRHSSVKRVWFLFISALFCSSLVLFSGRLSPEYSLEGLVLKLKLQYFGHLMWLIGKDPDTGEDWRPVEKGTTEDEMVGWHPLLNGHEFQWTPGVGDGQGGLVCHSLWGRKESDTTERLNSPEHKLSVVHNPNAWSLCTRPCSMWSLPFSPLAHTSPAFISTNIPSSSYTVPALSMLIPTMWNISFLFSCYALISS